LVSSVLVYYLVHEGETMTIFNLPIEPIEDRYSIDWQNWFEREFLNYGIPYTNVFGEKLRTDNKIITGSFLDVLETNYYKSTQLQELIRLIYNDEIDGDSILFFHDLWNPSLESLAYIRDGMGIPFKIMGCLHAGTYDKHDFLNQKGMEKWAAYSEISWFKKIVDKIFVATEFHKNLLCFERMVDKDKVYVTGFPIYPRNSWSEIQKIKKDYIIIFPHRLDPEKNPNHFDKLEETLVKLHKMDDWKFLKTKVSCKDKKEYYRLLELSKIAVSFADQETWGIAMQEAVFAGCVPFVPNRLSYPELYKNNFIYDSWDNLVRQIQNNPKDFAYLLQEQYEKFALQGRQAIPNIIKKLLAP
jgi:glycosyltransferase involved in cell wall biosynthesis